MSTSLKKAIDLFPHNQAAYESAVSMLAQTGKAAIIHPTGTGKSFIGFKLAEDHPEAVVCWLSPSEYIFKTQIENLISTGAEAPVNVVFFTYAKLMNMNEEEIREINPDYIILDEFHRCGAEMWGKGVEKLINQFPHTPILGLSATNIRYLDNQRDMADELFDGNIASEMTLGEAIVRGILAAPKYVLSVYSYQQNLDKYKNRINRAKSKAVRDTAEEYFERLRRALEKAEGLDEIFNKHMSDRTGKYIIFTSNIEALNECVSMVPRWFGKVDKKPHIYTVYSDDPAASRSFKQFKEDNDNKHLRLLFAIDALNEGVHVEDVSGVILFRPTVSPIIYKQQIGRALSASKKKEPVIFDIVNNFENLYSIGTIEEEMKAAVTYYNFFGDGHEIITENFKVYDEVRECRRLFDELEETLTASWDLMYSHAKEFYKEHGNLEVPSKYKTEEGYSLGHWLHTQRKVRAGEQYGKLDDERIEKLDAIGMVWEGLLDLAWNKYYTAAKEYRKQNGDLNIGVKYITDDGIRIGAWISNLRVWRKSGNNSRYMTEERIEALDALDMIWDQPDFLWERNFSAALEYYRQNGNLDVPARCIVNGVNLGSWIRNLRSAETNKNVTRAQMTKSQIQRLNEIGMLWTDKFTRQWEAAYEEAVIYHKTHGDLNVPTTYVSPTGYRLGRWISSQCDTYINKKIKPERKERLDEIGMIWQKPDSWEIRFALAKAYWDEHGNLDIPYDYVVDGVWLHKWLNEQRHTILGNRSEKLTREQINRLKAIGFEVKTKAEMAWDSRYEEAKTAYEANGSLNIPDDYESGKGKRILGWLTIQRRGFKSGKLSTYQIDKLNNLGMVWEQTDAWEESYQRAARYYSEHGDLNVPNGYLCADGYNLSNWLINQRSNHNNPRRYRYLTDEQTAKLEAIGMIWSINEFMWDSSYALASEYYLNNGNLNVPTDYKTESGYSLGDWVRQQVEKHREGKLTKEQIAKLESIGMDWLLPSEREWEKHFSSAERYFQRNGNLNIPTSYIDEDGFALGLWLWRIKTGKTKISENGGNGNQIKRLKSIGMVFTGKNQGNIQTEKAKETSVTRSAVV